MLLLEEIKNSLVIEGKNKEPILRESFNFFNITLMKDQKLIQTFT